MVHCESCELCLTTVSERFVQVFGEDNQEKELARIISKYLWFNLKPTHRVYLCSECWKSVTDFHQFYTKLEGIHNKEHDDSNSSCNAKPITQLHFEFHPVETIKMEEMQTEDVDEWNPNDLETKKVSNARPKRASAAQANYKIGNSDSDSENDCLATNDGDQVNIDDVTDNSVNVKGEPDDDDDEEVINYDMLNNVNLSNAEENEETAKDVKSNPWEAEVLIVTPKRGRGRPPKVKTEPRPVKEPKKERKLRRRTMGHLTCSESEDEYMSDLEDTLGSNEWKRRKNSKGHSPKSASSREERDKRIFSYINEFTCNYCPEKVVFERFHHANQHYKQVHNEPAFLRCPKCGKKCFTPGGFVSHMETHEDPERNKCNICGKVTDQKITLKKHMRAHQEKLEKNNPFSCSLCPRRFESQEMRDKHERLHGRKVVIKKEKGRDLELLAFYKRIYCDVCEESNPESTSFDNFWDLKVHMGNEHNKTPYLKCPICLTKYGCRQQLITHVDLHNNPEHYRCEVCKELHQNLDKHMIKAHTPETTLPEEKNYSCEHCGKMFKYRTNLRSHIDRVHGVKDVCCNICNKYFNHKTLNAHKRTAHTDEMFMCEHCPKMFKTRSGLESHKGDHDETQRKSVKCNLCGKEMRRGASMAKHMKTIHSQEDPVNCNLCGKTFRTSFHMMRHRANTCAATINTRPYKCEVCGKGFAMKLTMTEHMTTHTRTSLYQCAFCFKTFGYISNLYKHRKKAHPVEWQEVQARPEQGIATVIEIRN